MKIKKREKKTDFFFNTTITKDLNKLNEVKKKEQQSVI